MAYHTSHSLLLRKTICYILLLVTPLCAGEPIELQSWGEKSITHDPDHFMVVTLPLMSSKTRADGRSENLDPRGQNVESALQDQSEQATSLVDPGLSRRSDKLVDRMPMSFGKRETDVPIPFLWAPGSRGDQGSEEVIRRVNKAKLSLMPMQFGKRRDPPTSLPEIGFTQPIDEEEGFRSADMRRVARGRLQRMPLTFGKRVPEEYENAGDELTSFHSTDDPFLGLTARSGRLNRMPTYYGKRAKLESPGDIRVLTEGSGKETDHEEARELSSNRWRSSFSGQNGRFEITTGPHPAEALTPEASERKRDGSSRMDRMPLTFGKREIENKVGAGHENVLFPDNDISERWSQRNDDSEYGFRKGWMPKQTHQVRDENSAHVANLYALLQSNNKRAMDLPIGHRRLRNDPHGLSQHLKTFTNRLSPKEINEFKTNPREFIQTNLLVRALRSRLGRMPLTYGKRLGPSSSISNKRRNADYKSLILKLRRRSRMDRMPLSFGKRSGRLVSLRGNFQPSDEKAQQIADSLQLLSLVASHTRTSGQRDETRPHPQERARLQQNDWQGGNDLDDGEVDATGLPSDSS